MIKEGGKKEEGKRKRNRRKRPAAMTVFFSLKVAMTRGKSETSRSTTRTMISLFVYVEEARLEEEEEEDRRQE